MIVLLSTQKHPDVIYYIAEPSRILSDDVAMEIVQNLVITKYTTDGLRLLANDIDGVFESITRGKSSYSGPILSYIELSEEISE